MSRTPLSIEAYKVSLAYLGTHVCMFSNSIDVLLNMWSSRSKRAIQREHLAKLDVGFVAEINFHPIIYPGTCYLHVS